MPGNTGIHSAAAAVMLCALTLAQPALAREGDEFIRQMNLGKAYLENRNSAKAIEAFGRAVKLAPRSAPARRNFARAYLLARDHEQALSALEHANEIDPESAATKYLTGLTLTRQTRFADAVEYFEAAVRLDPNTAALRFQLANAYQNSGVHDKAAEQLRETTRLDPLHASAHFKLAAYARKAGDREEFQRRTREFMRLRKLFGDVTRTAEVLEMCAYTRPEAPSIGTGIDRARGRAEIDVHFLDATDTAFPAGGGTGVSPVDGGTGVSPVGGGTGVSPAGGGTGVSPVGTDRKATAAAVIAVEDDGRCVYFAVDADGALSLMSMSANGVFKRRLLDLKVPTLAPYHGCRIGDFYNRVPKGDKFDPKIHAFNDVLLYGSKGIVLLEQISAGVFQNVTKNAGLSGVTANRATWLDYEHDGDLDMLLACDTGLDLRQNNGDGTFKRMTEEVGIRDAQAASDAIGVDLDMNVAIDILVAHGDKPTRVFVNQRAGRFAAMPEPPGPWPQALRLLAGDLDNDGDPDVLLVREHDVLILSERASGRRRIDLPNITITAATTVDYDNDGWLDLLITGRRNSDKRGALRLFRSDVDHWSDVSEATKLSSLDLPPVRRAIHGDVDADGDSDVLLVGMDDRLRLLRNEGGHLNGQLKLKLTTVKSSPGGLGTHIELRRGGFWVTRRVTRLPIEIGLGGHGKLDTLQTLWMTAVVDNKLEVDIPHAPLTIIEKNVATGSCPFLFAHDGGGFRFVTDILGNAPIGLPLRRDLMLPTDVDELVEIGDSSAFPPLDGAYTVQVTEEFCETLYLDGARLVAVDHPAGIEIHPTDKLMPEPFPVSELWALSKIRTPLSASGDDGLDRTDAVQRIDALFAPPGVALPPPFRGMCYPLSITLDFGSFDSDRPLVLALTGWLNYGQASANIAISQSPANTVISPTLEVETAGGWRPIDAIVGMPAGKTKTILCDLTGKLPSRARRLRLTTTFEIRWDRIALCERVSLGADRTHELEPSGAELGWRGFSKIKSRAEQHPTTPMHDVVFENPPWRSVQAGWCTRYGDVLELIQRTDDRLVIMSAGDALTIRFNATQVPRIPEGYERTFFFYSFGWEKDGDPNVTGGESVGPLPSRGLSASQPSPGGESDWRIEYNTRYVPRDRFHPPRREHLSSRGVIEK